MQFATKIRDSGWGAIFLTVYTALIIHQRAPQQHLLKLIAVLPTLLVMFLADRYNFHLIHFFAGDKLQQSTAEVDNLTGDADFYESASDQLQQRVDDFDRRAYRNNISILAGLVIAVTAPFAGFYFFNLAGAVAGTALAAFSIQLLSRRSVQQLNTLAQNVTKPYTAQYEN